MNNSLATAFVIKSLRNRDCNLHRVWYKNKGKIFLPKVHYNKLNQPLIHYSRMSGVLPGYVLGANLVSHTAYFSFLKIQMQFFKQTYPQYFVFII